MEFPLNKKRKPLYSTVSRGSAPTNLGSPSASTSAAYSSYPNTPRTPLRAPDDPNLLISQSPASTGNFADQGSLTQKQAAGKYGVGLQAGGFEQMLGPAVDNNPLWLPQSHVGTDYMGAQFDVDAPDGWTQNVNMCDGAELELDPEPNRLGAPIPQTVEATAGPEIQDEEGVEDDGDRFLTALDTSHMLVSSYAPTNRKRGRRVTGLDDADLWLLEHVPMMVPSVPSPENRVTNVIPNPFLEGCEERYITLEVRVKHKLPENGKVNGYIKFQFSPRPSIQSDPASSAPLPNRSLSRNMPTSRSSHKDQGGMHALMTIPRQPQGFATGVKLDSIDKGLLTFHKDAYCPGRMLLPDNYWSSELISMAMGNECTRHALFCFTASYMLDYRPTELMRQRANLHYRTAVKLLSDALAKSETYEVGQESAVIAAIVMIFSNDIVNWEIRRPKGQEPLWRAGARAARTILDRTDPGYRYYRSENVQTSGARFAHANWVAYVDILAQPVTPLEDEHTKESFGWLLEGTYEGVRNVQGITGMCPKLLHMYAQITHLAARLDKMPDSSLVVIKAAEKLEENLKNLEQSYKITPSSEPRAVRKLLDLSALDDDRTASDVGQVTELTAQAYALAAEIYLHCRVFRKPRSHPDVIKSLDNLAQCIRRMPCTGHLFTSQSPFFAVFILAVVAHLHPHRAIAKHWFELVISGASCRSSVPPVWEAVKKLWTWMDSELVEDEVEKDRPVHQRTRWWEHMVDKLIEECGVLSLV